LRDGEGCSALISFGSFDIKDIIYLPGISNAGHHNQEYSGGIHQALKVRAAHHGRSTEAEIREILARAVKPNTSIRGGDALASADFRRKRLRY